MLTILGLCQLILVGSNIGDEVINGEGAIHSTLFMLPTFLKP